MAISARRIRKSRDDGGLVHHHALAFSTLLSSQETSATPSRVLVFPLRGDSLNLPRVFRPVKSARCNHHRDSHLTLREFPWLYLTGLLNCSVHPAGRSQRPLAAAAPPLVKVDNARRHEMRPCRKLAR